MQKKFLTVSEVYQLNPRYSFGPDPPDLQR